MPITKPLLPPKAGYVEVIDKNGDHVYKPTAETVKELQKEAELNDLIASVNVLLGVKEDG